jgi:hypothetical protein
MFQTGHLHELKPETWREDLLGEGASGTVYRAEWRGVAVAVGHAMHTPPPPRPELLSRHFDRDPHRKDRLGSSRPIERADCGHSAGQGDRAAADGRGEGGESKKAGC